MGGVMYFAAADAAGVELWRTDGTGPGTFRVVDINPGAGSSNPSGLTTVGNMLLFSANDGTSGIELWSSNGSAVGTTRVKDLNPGASSGLGLASRFTVGLLLFNANNTLWRSDGSDGGTELVKSIRPGGSFAVVGTFVYLSAADTGANYELWKSDGTADGTVLVKEIAAGTTAGVPEMIQGLPNSFVQTNGSVYFVGADTGTGDELWKTDGTAAGTVLVKDILLGNLDSTPVGLTALNGTIFFAALDGAGYELWRSDGTAPGTVRVADISPGSSSAAPWPLGTLNGVLIFGAFTSGTGEELWTTLRTPSDFDGEGKADLVVYRPDVGQWWIKRSFGNFNTSLVVSWGLSGDLPVPADFDRDGKVDPAVFRTGTGALWFVSPSSANYANPFAVYWGTTGDVPVPADYDGDRLSGSFVDPTLTIRPTCWCSGAIRDWGMCRCERSSSGASNSEFTSAALHGGNRHEVSQVIRRRGVSGRHRFRFRRREFPRTQVP
jgi:ELWxxDGT repeat protein